MDSRQSDPLVLCLIIVCVTMWCNKDQTYRPFLYKNGRQLQASSSLSDFSDLIIIPMNIDKHTRLKPV